MLSELDRVSGFFFPVGISVVWDKAPNICGIWYTPCRCFSFLLPFSVLTLASSSFIWFLPVLLSKDRMGSEICFPTLLYPISQSCFFSLQRALTYVFMLLRSRDLIALSCFSCPFHVLLVSRWENQNCTQFWRNYRFIVEQFCSLLLSTLFLVNAKALFFTWVFLGFFYSVQLRFNPCLSYCIYLCHEGHLLSYWSCKDFMRFLQSLFLLPLTT